MHPCDHSFPFTHAFPHHERLRDNPILRIAHISSICQSLVSNPVLSGDYLPCPACPSRITSHFPFLAPPQHKPRAQHHCSHHHRHGRTDKRTLIKRRTEIQRCDDSRARHETRRSERTRERKRGTEEQRERRAQADTSAGLRGRATTTSDDRERRPRATTTSDERCSLVKGATREYDDGNDDTKTEKRRTTTRTTPGRMGDGEQRPACSS